MGRGDQDEAVRGEPRGVELLFKRRSRRGLAGGSERRHLSPDEKGERLLELYARGEMPVIREVQDGTRAIPGAIAVGRTARYLATATGYMQRGYVVVLRPAPHEGPCFSGVILHGLEHYPERQVRYVYNGASLKEACEAVNEWMAQRKSQFGYFMPLPGSGELELDARQIIAQVDQAQKAERA